MSAPKPTRHRGFHTMSKTIPVPHLEKGLHMRLDELDTDNKKAS